ncbi:MAG: hypothetical protein ACSLE9_17875 [Burkholderiaceae bacterium]
MEKSITLHVGLDVHKDSIDIATADSGATAKCATWAELPREHIPDGEPPREGDEMP